MAPLSGYHRPHSIEEALGLLTRTGLDSRLLAGGTHLNGGARRDGEVVDLQDLGLDTIELSGHAVTLGAMVTLQSLVEHGGVPPLIRDLAHREAPSTFRNAATVGGTIGAANPESVLVAGLLAHEAVLTIARVGAREEIGLAAVLTDKTALDGGIIAAVTFAAGGEGFIEATGRTPADTPIVAVVGRRTDEGNILLAATGIASTPVIVDPDRLDQIEPPGDFRGSAEYRKHLVGVLASRVLAGLN